MARELRRTCVSRGRGKAGLILFVLTLPLLLCRPAFADDAYLGRSAEGVFPTGETEVEMVAEEVTIDLLTSGPSPGVEAKATCVFTFRNTSAQPAEVLMGFPGEYSEQYREENLGGQGYAATVRDFTAAVDGTEVPVTLETGTLGPEEESQLFASWYTFPVSFAPDQTRVVVNTYRFVSPGNSIGDVYLSYVLRTGRYWKGGIGRAKVTVRLGDVGPWQLVHLYPGDWLVSPDGKALTWERQDFEPAYDLEVTYNVGHWSPGYLDNIGAEGREGFLAVRAEWEDLLAQAPGLGQNEVLALCRQALHDAAASETPFGVGGGPAVKAVYLRSLLGPDYSWQPPEITDMAAGFEGSSETPFLRLGYSDPDGDLASLRVLVTHDEDGQAVVDVDRLDLEPWLHTLRPSGNLDVGLGFASQPGRLYTFRVELEDGRGLTASRSVQAWTAAAAEPSSQSPETPPEPTPETLADTLALVLGSVAVFAVLTALVIVAVRNTSRPGKGR